VKTLPDQAGSFLIAAAISMAFQLEQQFLGSTAPTCGAHAIHLPPKVGSPLA
jgi:hypothetical protein